MCEWELDRTQLKEMETRGWHPRLTSWVSLANTTGGRYFDSRHSDVTCDMHDSSQVTSRVPVLFGTIPKDGPIELVKERSRIGGALHLFHLRQCLFRRLWHFCRCVFAGASVVDLSGVFGGTAQVAASGIRGGRPLLSWSMMPATMRVLSESGSGSVVNDERVPEMPEIQKQSCR